MSHMYTFRCPRTHHIHTHTHNRTKHKTNEKQKQLVNILNTRYLIFKCDEF